MKNQNTTKPYAEYGCRRPAASKKQAPADYTPNQDMLQAAKNHPKLFTAAKA